MYTAERQRAQPYLERITEPLIEQWYLLHHRMVRIITNRRVLAEQVRSYFYYGEFLAEYTYEQAARLPTDIPMDLLWLAGQRLYKPVAITCYLFETQRGEVFPPFPELSKPEHERWDEVTGIDGPLCARWKRDGLRLREFQAYPGVASRICYVVHKYDFYANVYIENVAQCMPWFTMRFVFYMALGAMIAYSGYEVLHAGAIALNLETSALIVGSPGSGKSTLILSCLQAGMLHLADDVLFVAEDDGLIRVYAFPEDIGIRPGAWDLLGHHDFMQDVAEDERQKRFIDIQQYFREQVIAECPIRVLLFVHEEQRTEEFRAERLSPAQAASLMMQEYISRKRSQEGDVSYLLDLFTEIAQQAPAYNLWLSPQAAVNAEHVRMIIEAHKVEEAGEA